MIKGIISKDFFSNSKSKNLVQLHTYTIDKTLLLETHFNFLFHLLFIQTLRYFTRPSSNCYNIQIIKKKRLRALQISSFKYNLLRKLHIKDHIITSETEIVLKIKKV